MFGCDGYKNFLVSWGETLDLYWTSSDHNHGVWCLITEEIGGDIYLDVRWDHNQLYLSQLIGKTGEILFIPNHVNRTQSQFDRSISNPKTPLLDFHCACISIKSVDDPGSETCKDPFYRNNNSLESDNNFTHL